MDNFFEDYEQQVINEYKKNGYIIRDIEENGHYNGSKTFLSQKSNFI